MADFGFFFNSVNGDRVCNAESFKTWIRSFFTNGVTIGSFETAKSGDTTITVSPGFVNINGTVQHFKESHEFEIQRGSGYRYDTIVIEYDADDEVRDIVMKIVKGGAEPVAPIQYSSLYQLVVATIYVPASGDITIQDNREDEAKCGYIKITASEKSAEDIAAEFVTYMAMYMSEKQEDFDAWFNAIKQETSEKMAGNVDSVMNNIQSAKQMEDDLDVFIDTTREDMASTLATAERYAFKSGGRYICQTALKNILRPNALAQPEYDTIETDKVLTDDQLKQLAVIESFPMLNKPMIAICDQKTGGFIQQGYVFSLGCFDFDSSSETYINTSGSSTGYMQREPTENTIADTGKGYEIVTTLSKTELKNNAITSDNFNNYFPREHDYQYRSSDYGRYSTEAALYTIE